MAKKFFYNRVYNTKRNITSAIIIGACIIGVIICFIVVSSFEGEDHSTKNGNLSIKNEVTVEVNQKYENDIFFSKIENVDLKDITVKHELNYDISKVGRYNVTLVIDNKEYSSILNVIDSTKPELILEDVEIKKGETYTADNFVTSCSDNSKSDCTIYFWEDGIDEDGNSVDYSKYTEEGKYQIRITAEDESGNTTTKDATLTIGKNDGSGGNEGGNNEGGNNEGGNEGGNGNDKPIVDEPVTCKYGDNSYDSENYLLAIDITANNCAISLDLYKDETMTTSINKLMDTETSRIKKDVEALNLTGTLALNRKVTAIINTSGTGIVGYELKMTVTITSNGETKMVTEYKVDNEGKRVFIENPYELAK